MKEELARIEPIRFDIQVVKVGEDTIDVIVAGEQAVLDSFIDVYDNLIYVERSKFGFPIVVAPDFPNLDHAKVWKEYWDAALSDPANSCESCQSIHQFFGTFLRKRGEYAKSPERN